LTTFEADDILSNLLSLVLPGNGHAPVLISCVCPAIDWDEEDRQAKRIDL